MTRVDEKKADSAPAESCAAVKQENTVAMPASRGVMKASAKPVIEVTDEKDLGLSPSVPPARNTLKLSAAEQAKLTSRVYK